MTPRLVVLMSQGPSGAARAAHVARRCIRAGLEYGIQKHDLTVLVAPGSWRLSDDLLVTGEVKGDPAAAGRICADDPVGAGEALVRSCWGAYVAILLTRQGPFILTDPSGAGAAHLCRDDELVMVADVLSPQLALAARFKPAVREDVLAGGLIDPSILTTASVLNHVAPLIPGVLTPLAASLASATLWSPQIVRSRSQAQTGALSAAVDLAVGALRGRHPLVQLSGGFDSAVVLGTAARSGELTAFTVVSDVGDVDESPYAQDAARLSDVELVVATDGALPGFAAFMGAPQTAHPYLHGLDEVFDRQMEQAVRRYGCDRVLTGQGGDAVFLQPQSAATTIDRFADRGASGLLTGIVDDAIRGRTSIWTPIRAVLRHVARGSEQPMATLLTPHLLTREALHGAQCPQHPWTMERDRRRPGRELQTRLLANALIAQTRRPFPGSVPIINPLLSQPVLEAVLATPTWQLASGTRDRGLARRIFADRIPASIASRTTKGQASALFSRAVAQNLPYLRMRLLDGHLASRRILDRSTLDACLRPDHLAHSADFRSFMFLASCEAWLEAWS